MKSTTMILLGAALVAGGIVLSKKMSREDKEKFKDMMKKKLRNNLPKGLQDKISVSN